MRSRLEEAPVPVGEPARLRPSSVTILPRGVRWISPSCRRYGSYTSSIVSGSSPSATARVERPTGAAVELVRDRSQELPVGALEALPVHLQQVERFPRDRRG